LTAEVIEVSSLAELDQRAASLPGRFVFFNHTMGVATDYARFGELRNKGPALAGKLGAVGAVVRSLATASFRSPHTGGTKTDGVRIPAAAISVEDAELLHRLLAAGPVKVHLVLGCRNLPDAMSSNVVAEIRGRERTDEVVLLGAHLDSWDLAVGAQDDGAGVAMVLETARLIAGLSQRPLRTVRFVLFMNEENGARGAKAYAATHAAELGQLVAAMELDAGSGAPRGVALKAGPGGANLVQQWLPPLARVGAAVLLEEAPGGSDLRPLEAARVPEVVVRQDMTHYFDIHHSAADTLDRVDPEGLVKTTAAVAWMIYALADSVAILPRPDAPPPAEEESPAARATPTPAKSAR
jgi:carboxypeptidase Q